MTNNELIALDPTRLATMAEELGHPSPMACAVGDLLIYIKNAKRTMRQLSPRPWRFHDCPRARDFWTLSVYKRIWPMMEKEKAGRREEGKEVLADQPASDSPSGLHQRGAFAVMKYLAPKLGFMPDTVWDYFKQQYGVWSRTELKAPQWARLFAELRAAMDDATLGEDLKTRLVAWENSPERDRFNARVPFGSAKGE